MDLWPCQELAWETRHTSESLSAFGSPQGPMPSCEGDEVIYFAPNPALSSEARRPLSLWLRSQLGISCQPLSLNSKC